jgi:hypothetical protein
VLFDPCEEREVAFSSVPAFIVAPQCASTVLPFATARLQWKVAGELFLAGDFANTDYPLLWPLLLRFPLEHIGTLGEQLVFERFGIVIVNQAQRVADVKGIQAREDERVTLAGHDGSYIEILNN